MKTVLITGYRGFIGQSLFNTLSSNEDFRVIVVGSPSDDFSGLPGHVTGFNVGEIFEGKLAGQPIDIVVNCAISYENSVVGENSPLIVNLQLPLLILESLIGNEMHFINLDTSLNKRNIPYLARPIYSLSKMHFKEYLRLRADSGQVKVSNLVLEHVYGLNSLKRSTLLSELILRGVEGNTENLKLSPGGQVRDFIYVEDVAAAIYNVIHFRLSKFDQNYLDIPVGSGTGIKIYELAQMIQDKLNMCEKYPIGSAPYRDNEIMSSIANLDLMKKLNWAPKVSLNEGLDILLESARRGCKKSL